MKRRLARFLRGKVNRKRSTKNISCLKQRLSWTNIVLGLTKFQCTARPSTNYALVKLICTTSNNFRIPKSRAMPMNMYSLVLARKNSDAPGYRVK